jgi:hypothetical protein
MFYQIHPLKLNIWSHPQHIAEVQATNEKKAPKHRPEDDANYTTNVVGKNHPRKTAVTIPENASLSINQTRYMNHGTDKTPIKTTGSMNSNINKRIIQL